MSIHKFQCQSKKIRGGGGGGGGCLALDPPTTTTSKLKFDILDLKKNFLVRLWGGGGGGVWF